MPHSGFFRRLLWTLQIMISNHRHSRTVQQIFTGCLIFTGTVPVTEVTQIKKTPFESLMRLFTEERA